MDIYDKAVKFLRKNPDRIIEIWDEPNLHWSGILFQAATPDGLAQMNNKEGWCGDLCEIRSHEAVAWTRKLTEDIINDERIPKVLESNKYIPKITIDNLYVFAEWQRKIDSLLSRNPENFKAEENGR